MNRMAAFLLGATLALGFSVAAYFLSTAVIKARQNNIIRVKGVAETRVSSDQGTWFGCYSVKNPDLRLAYGALSEARGIVEEALAPHIRDGVAIIWDAVEVDVEYVLRGGERTNQIENYVLRQRVRAEGSDVEAIQALAGAISTVIAKGVYFDSTPPSFTVSGIERIKADLLKQATRNAYERARIMAENSGGKVSGISSATQGVFQITRPNSTETHDYGAYDTDTIVKVVRAVVTVEFNVDS